MISVITPHYAGSNVYIEETYKSLAWQNFQDWQWVVVLNHGGELSEYIRADERVKVIEYTGENSGIGFLKRLACENCDGEIIAELDSDDLLTETALSDVWHVFDEHQDTIFVYSNHAEFTHETWQPHQYGAYWGWKSRPFEWRGHSLIEQIAMPPTPPALRAIYWSPNHIRAWRTKDYWEIGGHNPALAVGDDYDLVCRFYLRGKIEHIDKCLYLYRVHGDNTTITRNAQIQASNADLYARYIIPLVETWARREALPMLDLGGAFNSPPGYLRLDKHPGDNIIACDLEKRIPFPSNGVGVVRAYDFLEHVHNPVKMMNEIYRVLAPGGWVLASVPSTDGRGAFQDPTHVSFWNENSFWYYTNPSYAKYVPEIKCKFQSSRVITWFPSDFHRQHNISYVDAQLIAVKDGYQPIGENLWQS